MENTAEKKQFQVTDISSAEWVMEKIAEKQSALKEMAEQRDKMIARYQEWYNNGVAKAQEDMVYFESLLSAWAKAELEGKKAKSIPLPSGRIGFRAGTQTVTFNGSPIDKTAPEFIKAVKAAAPEYIEKKESVRWADFKKTLHLADGGAVVSAEGEIMQNMAWSQGEPSFYVKVGD